MMMIMMMTYIRHEGVCMIGGVFPCILNLDTRLDETDWPTPPSGHVTSGYIAPGTRLVGPHLLSWRLGEGKIHWWPRLELMTKLLSNRMGDGINKILSASVEAVFEYFIFVLLCAFSKQL